MMHEEHQDPFDDSQKRYELFLKEREELLRRDLSNVVNLDKAILSLSTAGLGFSLVFVRNVISWTDAAGKCVLYLSWIMFGAAILSTLASYLFGQYAIKKQNELNEKFLLKGDDDARNQRPLSAKITDGLKYVSVTTYFFALFFFVLFTVLN